MGEPSGKVIIRRVWYQKANHAAAFPRTPAVVLHLRIQSIHGKAACRKTSIVRHPSAISPYAHQHVDHPSFRVAKLLQRFAKHHPEAEP